MSEDSTMFNVGQKQKYIDYKMQTTTLNKFFLPNVFKQSYQFENQLRKDISNFTVSEIEDMYKTMNFVSLASLTVLNSAYSLYTGWCLSALHNVEDSQNHFLEFSTETLKGLVNRLDASKKIISREFLLNQIKSLYNPSDKFLMLALFEGIKGKDYEEIWSLRKEDVNAVKCTINMKRGEKFYSPELCKYAAEAAVETNYYPFRQGKNNSLDGERRIEFLPSDLVIKEYLNIKEQNPTNFRQGRRIYSKYVRILKYLELDNILPNDIYNSGIIDFINTKAKEKGITGKEYVRNYSSEITNYYEKKLTKPFLDQYEDYLV